MALGALVGWRGAERALRLGQPLPGPRLLPALVGLVVGVGLVLGGYALAAA